MDFSGFEKILSDITNSKETDIENKCNSNTKNRKNLTKEDNLNNNKNNDDLIKNLQQQVFEQIENDNKNLPKKQKYSKEVIQNIHSGHRQRARERFLANPEATSDYDLLELLLFLIVPRADVKQSAKILIDEFKTLNNLFSADIKKLNQYNVNGESIKYLSILLKIVQQRVLKQQINESSIINNSQVLIEYCQNNLATEKEEQFHILFLNSKLKLIEDINFGLSGISSVTLSYRDIMKKCIELKAANVILYHNHPNQDIEPSREDIETTDKIINLLKSIDVEVIDHIIVSGSRYYSFKHENLI